MQSLIQIHNYLNVFDENIVHKMNRCWEGWLAGSGRGYLGRGAQATKVISFLKIFQKHERILGGVDAWIWKGKSGERSPGNTSKQFPSEIGNNINRFWEGWPPGSGSENLGRGAQATQ